jgi:hypothetical protein
MLPSFIPERTFLPQTAKNYARLSRKYVQNALMYSKKEWRQKAIKKTEITEGTEERKTNQRNTN